MVLIIDNIYWERIQLFIEGHVNDIELNKKNFVLRNLTETKELAANDVNKINPIFRVFSAIKYLVFGTSLDEKS